MVFPHIARNSFVESKMEKREKRFSSSKWHTCGGKGRFTTVDRNTRSEYISEWIMYFVLRESPVPCSRPLLKKEKLSPAKQADFHPNFHVPKTVVHSSVLRIDLGKCFSQTERENLISKNTKILNSVLKFE